MDLTRIVDFGPGHVDTKTDKGEAALVALDLDTLDMAPSDTRAVLHLVVMDFDDRDHTWKVGIELTRTDLIRLGKVCARTVRETDDA